MVRIAALLRLLGLLLLAVSVPAQSLAVYPGRITLDSQLDRHRVVVVLTSVDEATTDVTATATLCVEPGGIAEMREGRLVPLADGDAQLVVEYLGLRTVAAVSVRGFGTAPFVSFRNDVEPVLMLAGCNAGSCHGAAAGKNGFALSLFGFDPAFDHRSLTREQRGRRVDLLEPEHSLLLAKPAGQVAHKGGKKLPPADPGFAVLREWIAQGAIDDGDRAPELADLRVEPPSCVLVGEGATLRVVISAHYSDGSVRDVTEHALVSSSESGTLTVDGDRLVAGAPGESVVLARFGHLAAVATGIVIDAAASAASDMPGPANEIDGFVYRKLVRRRLTPSATCDDAVFLRRLALDTQGRLPTVAEVREFAADPTDDKRARWIDRMLEGDGFVDLLAAEWAELLRIDPDRIEPKGAHRYTAWLRESLRRGVPFDRLARELLLATGSGFANPPANYWLVVRDPKVIAENTAQAFLGIRLQCAQCHNHPFDRWRSSDYYGFAAFFGQVGRKRGNDPRELIVFDAGRGEVIDERTRRAQAPRVLGGDEAKIASGRDRREVLAEWMTSPDNPFFARNLANRLWARFFGRGLVEPVDDMRASNPPTHPELLDFLAQRLVATNYDLRALARLILASNTWQAAAPGAKVPAGSLVGQSPRRLRAEVLLDAVGAVTGVPTKLRGVPLGGSAFAVVEPDARNSFLRLFGRPLRESVCACERREEPTLNQVLHLIHGDTIDEKLAAKDGRLHRLLAADTDNAAILDEFWLAAYARSPRPEERERVLALLRDSEDRAAAWEDALWAVLNSKEFLFWH
ncbi:MAG: DUF1549 domain-containing protein [Planctomycetota bacterium]